MPGREECHAVKLKRERLAGKVQIAGVQQRFKIGLEEKEETLREFYDIARRRDPCLLDGRRLSR